MCLLNILTKIIRLYWIFTKNVVLDVVTSRNIASHNLRPQIYQKSLRYFPIWGRPFMTLLNYGYFLTPSSCIATLFSCKAKAPDWNNIFWGVKCSSWFAHTEHPSSPWRHLWTTPLLNSIYLSILWTKLDNTLSTRNKNLL